MTSEMEGEDLRRLRRRYERERRARLEAEAIADRVTGELYTSLQELEQLNARLGETNRELESANQAIRDFVSVASHDLRGPLTSILGFANILQGRPDDIDDGQKTEFIGIINSQAQRLSRLVDDLLTVSKIESGVMEARIEEICIAHALDDIMREFGERGVSFRPGSRDLRVLVDPDHLDRMIRNYVTNALKYGAPPIEAVIHDSRKWAEIRVTDVGDGVPEEFVPRLFEKFARAATHATVAKEGTGLGLSIVRGLALANGGLAWYEPNHPSGSCFALRLQKQKAP